MLEFTFNGVSCNDFGLMVKTSNHLSSFPKNLELIQIPGRTGSLIIDDDSYGNKVVEIECILKSDKPLIESSKLISKWLQGVRGYKTLQYNDGSVFNAICVNQIEISKVIENFGEVVIQFEVEGENPNDTTYIR